MRKTETEIGNQTQKKWKVRKSVSSFVMQGQIFMATLLDLDTIDRYYHGLTHWYNLSLLRLPTQLMLSLGAILS